MPIYEYRCPDGHTFEIFQRMADAPVERCEVCKKGPVEKVLFPVAVHFKGSGFYSTDYGKGSRKGSAKDGDSPPSEKKESTTSTGSDASAASTSDSKSEKKSE
jgi:putative FmdB family regulatory protein